MQTGLMTESTDGLTLEENRLEREGIKVLGKE